MDELFESRRARVLCAYKGSDGRSALLDAIKGVGFSNVDGCDTVSDVLKRLETETYDWIILPLSKGTPINAIHIMDIVSRSAAHAGVKFSLLLEPDEVYVLPLAFELGLLSWHPATFNRTAAAKEMEALMGRISAHKGEVALVAAETLRELLIRDNRLAELKTFSQSMYQVFPRSPTALAWLAEAEFLAGDREGGRKAISTLKIWGAPHWEPLAGKYLGSGQELLPDIGLRDVIVVDPDEMVLKSVSDLLTKCGVAKIRQFTDGQAAYESISQELPDLVIHEWKVPQLAGPNFIQRVRQDGHHQIPLVVFSSLVTKQDLPLLQEMTVAHLIQKPFREEDMLESLIWIVQQERFPTQQRSLERRMHQEILLGNVKKAQGFRSTLEAEASYPESRRIYNAALFAFYANDFESARNGFLKAIQFGADYLSSVNMLGKCFMKLRNFKDAIACFEKAAALSPKNLERMCALAESHSGLGEADAAKLAIKAAENQDAGNGEVKRTAAKVEIEVGDVRKAAQMLGGLGSLPTLVADMNNSAVAMIRMKDYAGGLKLYEKTLAALPAKETGLKIRVTYNLALAYVRRNDVEKAADILKTIPENFISPVMGKVRKLEKKVKSAILQARDVVLDPADEESISASATNENSASEEQTSQAEGSSSSEGTNSENASEQKNKQPQVLTAEQLIRRTQEHVVSAKAGDRCCHMIFHCPESMQPQARELLANPPKFKMREAIKKEEGFGVERGLKSS